MATTETQAQTQTQTHGQEVGQEPMSRAPSRRRHLAVAAAAVAALVAVAGVVVLAQDSITAGSDLSRVVVQGTPPAGRGDDGDEPVEGAVTEVTNTYGTEYHVAAQDGRYLDLVVSVRNEGLLPVRLTEVVPTLASEESVHVLDDVQVTVPVDASRTAWRPVGDGIVVEPGRSLPIRTTGRFATACGSATPPVEAGGSIGTDRLLDLGYTVLGLPRRASPVTSWTVMFDGPLGCPAPVS